MDPRKLSTQELVQLCLASRDETLWAEFVRRFQQRLCKETICVYAYAENVFLRDCTNYFNSLQVFLQRKEMTGSVKSPRAQSNFHNSLGSGIGEPWIL